MRDACMGMECIALVGQRKAGHWALQVYWIIMSGNAGHEYEVFPFLTIVRVQ